MAAPLSYERFHNKIIKTGRKEVNDLERYLMYLRKSRMDTDYENVSVAETLSRHRTILENFCKAKKLHVVEVLEEVVSGESLYARPEMMRLLELINTGMYAGVVCMDIERLSRGSSLESGHIMQVLQVNSCKIITPGKTYDLQNDSDEQFTDMKFMFEPDSTKEPEPALTPEPTVKPLGPQDLEPKVLVIKGGESSVSVSKNLEELGLVESASEYDSYLCKNGYDKVISVGTYEIPIDASYEDIARIITRR